MSWQDGARSPPLSSLEPFLPPHLLRALGARGAPARLPHVERFGAALLFSDISGFTSLTEALQSRGREGAEEITDIVRTAFLPAIEAIHRSGGSIVSFGGDALFVLFTEGGSVRRAVTAAEAVREHFERHGDVATSVGTTRLRISQALHYGDVTSMHLGRGDRRHYIVCGPPVRALARLQARTPAGRILLSRSARRKLAEPDLEMPGAPAPVMTDELLLPYVAPHVRASLGRFEGEYRRAVMVFLETKGARGTPLQRFAETLFDVLDRYGGILVSTDLSPAGTKWLCAFGAPVTHEDDAARAGRAALDLQRQLPRGLPMRGGMHVGTVANVWMGSGARRSYELMGEVTNTAARAASKCAWGEVVVTEEVRAQLEGVVTAPRGSFAAKGMSRPLELHAILATRAPVERMQVAAPMIGRDAELGRIVEALEAARRGQGSAIAVRGEAGMGKSRMKYEASRVARTMGLAVHEGRALSFGGSAYGTIGTLLKDALGLPELPGRELVRARVTEVAERLGMKPVDRRHLTDVLGDPGSSSDDLPPKEGRLNAMIATSTFFREIARETPRLLVLEDMHWADEASAEAAEWLIRGAGAARYVVLLLHRPGYEPPAPAARMELADLDDAALGRLLEAHLGPVPAEIGRLLRERAGGNPFYVEEVVRHLLEAGILGLSDDGYQIVRPLRHEDLPDGLETMIAARLDRLSAGARRVAQHGAVIGRSFLFRLLERLREAEEAARSAVGELSARELIYEWRAEPLEYIWKHAITRDVAYAGILAARRRELHGMVADALEEMLAGEREPFLAMIGHHREKAGQRGRARDAYLDAARHAARRYAYAEAEALYRSMLALVEGPTAQGAGARHELGETVLQPRGRMEEAEVEHRAAALEARSIGDRALEAAALQQLALIRGALGRMDEARSLLDDALALARELESRALEGRVCNSLGTLHREQGRMEEARAWYGEARAIARALGDRQGEGRVLNNLGTLEREQGRVEEAGDLYGLALAVARETGNRRLQESVLGNMANLHSDQGRASEARAFQEEGLRLALERGNRRSEMFLLGSLAIVHAQQGRVQEARALQERALSIAREVRDRKGEAVVLGNLAILRSQQGHGDAARALLEEALAIHREVGNRRFESVVLGNLAILHHKEARLVDALALYEEALRIHREVGDRRSEGIVLGNLARLEMDRGRIDEARRLHDEGLGIHRAVKNRPFEGVALAGLARLEILAGDGTRAEVLLDECQGLSAEIGNAPLLVEVHALRGHAALASGGDPEPSLRRARAVALEAGEGPESDSGATVAMLERAVAARDSGGALVRGYLPEDLPAGQLRWLREHQPGALAAEVRARLDDEGTLRPVTRA